MTRVCIYARVSSEEQAAEGKSSIQTQLDECRQLADSLGWHVAGVFVDDKKYKVGKRMVEPSGTRADRPGWRKMLAALVDGQADALLAWHSSRLFRAYRPMVDLLDVLDANPKIKVELVKEQFNKDTIVLYAWVARKENESRIQRVVFGMAGRARQGLPPSSHSSFFKPIIEPQTGAKLGYEFDERHRVYFDEMARLFLDRQPYHVIARRLGTNPVSGRPWSHVTIRAILRNPYYRGRLDYGRSTGDVRFSVPTAHRAVWDSATCTALESELARRSRFKTPRDPSIPFAGLLYCGLCGRPMSAATVRAKGQPFGRPYRNYTCGWPARIRRGEQLTGDHAPNWIAENKLIGLVQEQIDLLASFDPDEVISLLAAYLPAPTRGQGDTRELDALEAQIAELEPELARVRSAAARAAIDGELTRLKAQAELLRRVAEQADGPPPIDYERLRAGWATATAGPRLADLPDAALRTTVTGLFTTIYIAAGEIVPPPPQTS